MKFGTTTLALTAAFLFSPLSVADKGPALKDYPAEQVTENVYVIHGPLDMPNPKNQGFMNNPAFVITNDGIVVVDPGSSVQTGEMLLRVMAKISKKPVIAVFNTHIHGDHWLGNEGIKRHYPNAKIYGHPTMKTRVEGADGEFWLETINRLTEGTADGKRVVGPDKAVTEGDVITVGDTTFRIYHTGQAHTNNDIMVEIEGENTLFTGDVVRNGLLGIMEEDASFEGNIAAIDFIIGKKYD